MISEKISKKVKIERIKANLSQEEFAFRSCVSKNTIQKIETGKAKPTFETIEKIANALGIDFLTFVDVSKVEL